MAISREEALRHIKGIREIVTPKAPIPEKVSVKATSPVTLYYWDENGVARIPCTRTNPVKYGMPFGISAGPGGEEDHSTLVTGHVDTPELKVIPLSKLLTRSPPATIGRYEGLVSVDGGGGAIHAYICKCSCVCQR